MGVQISYCGQKLEVPPDCSIDMNRRSKITCVGTQATAISDATAAAGETVSKAEFDAVVAKLNATLAALRGIGVIAS